MTCSRCTGFLVTEWDSESRTQYHRCLQCGNRPHQVTYRVDGQPIDAPLLCRDCRTRPRMTVVKRRAHGEDELTQCAVCREADYQKRYAWKQGQYKRGPYKTYNKREEE